MWSGLVGRKTRELPTERAQQHYYTDAISVNQAWKIDIYVN